MSRYQLDRAGYFLRDGRRFWPVGCNYTSGSAGARFWQAWPETEIRVDLAAMQYTVAHGTKADPYTVGGRPGANGAAPAAPAFAWSKLSGVYHYSTCDWVKSIGPDNLETGNVPPAGKALHKDCPTHR